MKLNFNFSGKTLLKDWWKIVRDNFTAIQTDHNTLSDKLDTEITQRTNADVGLADKITAETKARESTDNTLQGNIDAEAKNRRVGDSELREQILTEQTNRTNADDILNGEKADKTDLYGKETDVVHTITHSLEKSDLSIDINTSYGDGTITINSLAVQTKIFLDGNSAIQTEPISASFSAEKGEEGEKWVNLLYDQYTGKLGLEVTEQPEAGNVAKIAVTYMKAEVAEMYAGQLKFDGIKDLRALKTDNKNSFLAAVNEIATKLTTEISDREDVEYSLTEKIITEISDRQAADNELKAKISDINTELTTDNLFYDLSKYVNSDNTLVTDDSGVQYLSYSDLFENGVYLYHNFVVDNFRRKPKTETTLELTFNVASRHIAGDGCDSGGLNIGETDVLITYTDTTTETFGQSYYTATDTGDKTITINGTSETYKTTKFKIEIPVKKEIKSISFRIVSDNYYTNGDPTGNVCEQETLIQSAVCYDDECVVARKELDDFVQVIETALDGKAPTNHASNGTGFGKGTRTAFGHVKLSEVINSSTGADAGIAVAPKAVKTAYDKAVSAYELADGKLDANFVSNGYAGIDEVTTTLSDMWRDRVAPPTTITVACSTSKHNITADYHCNGTNDQTVIQQAIDALPSTGGKIVLLEGTYNISGQINVNKPNVTICGMGNSTVLNCKQGIWGIAATQPNFTVANLKITFDTYNSTSICIYASGSRCKFENLDLSNAVYGINCGGGHSIIHNVTATDNNINIHLGSAYNIVSDCYSEDAKETGIRVEGICNIVTGCHISDAGTYGILVTSGGRSKVADNIIIRDSYSDSQYSIYVTSSAYNSCTDNVMIGKNYTNVGGTTNSFISNKYS